MMTGRGNILGIHKWYGNNSTKRILRSLLGLDGNGDALLYALQETYSRYRILYQYQEYATIDLKL